MKRSLSVREKILSLYRRWDLLDPITRGKRLRELTKQGCSRRGLAEELGISATSVRFHLDLTVLNPTEQEAVKGGASAKQAFVVLQKRREMQARIDRICQEQATSAISDQLAKDIALFLAKERIWRGDEDFKPKAVTIGEDYVERFFAELRWAFEVRFIGPAAIPRLTPRHKDFTVICQATCPDQKEYEFWFAWLADWLALSLLIAAPEVHIRDAALKKAPALLTAVLQGAI
jgi:predicted transcriptional regulator